MPRGVYLLGVGLALVALALAFTDWALSLQPGVTEANVRRIRAGMTSWQVEAILGEPTEVMKGEEKAPYHRRHEMVAFWPTIWFEWYIGDGHSVVVIFRHGVVHFVLDDLEPGWTSLPILSRLRTWLGW